MMVIAGGGPSTDIVRRTLVIGDTTDQWTAYVEKLGLYLSPENFFRTAYNQDRSHQWRFAQNLVDFRGIRFNRVVSIASEDVTELMRVAQQVKERCTTKMEES